MSDTTAGDWFTSFMADDPAVLRQSLRARWPAYAPDWSRVDADPGDAILGAFAHQLAAAATRVNQLPGVVARRFLNAAGAARIPPSSSVRLSPRCSPSIRRFAQPLTPGPVQGRPQWIEWFHERS